MSFMQRLRHLFGAKANQALSKAEDPIASLDYSYEELLDLQSATTRAVADIATARASVEQNAKRLVAEANKLEEQAATALKNGREDLAQAALTRKQGLLVEARTLQENHDVLVRKEEEAKANLAALRTQIATFRVRKETMKAQHRAAQAQVRVSEAFAGISGSGKNLGADIARAEEKVNEVTARAEAMGQLSASGVLEDLTGTVRDPLTREIEQLGQQSAVEADMARLKAQLQLDSPEQTKQIEG